MKNGAAAWVAPFCFKKFRRPLPWVVQAFPSAFPPLRPRIHSHADNRYNRNHSPFFLAVFV